LRRGECHLLLISVLLRVPPLNKEGTTAHNTIIPRIRQAWLIALRNIGTWLDPTSWELLTICESLLYGITNVINSNENGTLRTPEVWLIVFLIPLAIPRFSSGTEPITELVFGEANNAIPMPNKNRLTSTAKYEDFSVNLENQIKADALSAKPTVLSTLLPYLSDSLPLTGLNTRITISMGISNIPVFAALYPKINWRYNDLRNGPQENARVFKKAVRFPTANALILKSVKSSVGYFCLNSTKIKPININNPITNKVILRIEIGFPIVKARRIANKPTPYKIEPL